jgi:succinoglycan biosynthesis transport protein ExoP
MEQLLNSPLLAVLPEFRRPARRWLPNVPLLSSKQSVDILGAPSTPFAEALRGLRTKLLYSSDSLPCKVILVTSSVPGEGKSTISANFAALLAHSGKRVLLVEADMRNPSSSTKSTNPFVDPEQLDTLLDLPPGDSDDSSTRTRRTSSAQFRSDHLRQFSTDLSVLLTDTENTLQSVSAKTSYGMEIIHAGPTARFPAELLDSPRMRALLDSWKTQFDYIVLDSPPLLAVTDAAVLSHMADVTLLIARPGFTSSQGLKRALELLELSRETRVGVVLNAIDPKSASYSDYYGCPGPALRANTKEALHV